MQKFFRSKYLLIGVLSGLLLGGGWFAWAAIQSQVGLNVLNGSSNSWNPLLGATDSGAAIGTPSILVTAPRVLSITDYSFAHWTASDADNAASSALGGVALYTFSHVSNSNARILQPTIDAAPATGLLSNAQLLYNGGTITVAFDRMRSASTVNLTTVPLKGVALTITPSNISCTNTPAVGAQATCSIAAGSGTVRHVSTFLTACVATGANAQTPLVLNLRDGASGAGTVVWSATLSAGITASACVTTPMISAPGSATTAMTLEFAGAGVALSQQTVALQALDVN